MSRTCAAPGCNTILSRYNDGARCGAHEGADRATMRIHHNSTVEHELGIIAGKVYTEPIDDDPLRCPECFVLCASDAARDAHRAKVHRVVYDDVDRYLSALGL